MPRRHKRTLRYNTCLPATRQIGPMPVLGLWGVLCIVMVLFATLTGNAYGGRAILAAFATLAILFGAALLFAARGIQERAVALGPGAAWLMGVAVFLVYVMYALGTGTISL